MARAPNKKAIEAKKLYNKGYKLIDISRKLEVPEGTVRSWKKRYNWDNNKSATNYNNKCNVAKSKNKANIESTKKEIDKVLGNSELTDKQKLFCIYYAKCFNATKAYQKAYKCSYESSLSNAYRLMEKEGIKKEIENLKRNKLNRAFINEDDIFQKYIDIAFADMNDYAEYGQKEELIRDEKGKVILDEEGKLVKEKYNYLYFKNSNEVDGSIVSEVKNGKGGISIKLLDRMRALEWLSNHMNLLTTEQKEKLAIQQEVLEIKRKQLEEDEW